jgi:hypothetical protein
MLDEAQWPPLIEKEENITLEDVKFIFDQAAKKLDYTIQVAGSVNNKATTLATLLSGVLIALIGYIISQPSIIGNSKTAIAIIAMVYVYAVGAFLLRNLVPRYYYPTGLEPHHLLKNEFFTDDFETGRRTINLYLAVIERYQEFIVENEAQNNKRWRNYNISLRALIFMPLVLGTIYL